MGEIVLRRRIEPTLGVDVYEVKLGDEFLMSSLFTVAEVDVLVGGLGLGYTAVTALGDPELRRLPSSKPSDL